MRLKNHAKTLVGFAAGFICAGLLAAFLLTTQNAQASSSEGACLQMPLNYSGGTAYDKNRISINYKIPSCFKTHGYKVKSIKRANENTLAIEYNK